MLILFSCNKIDYYVNSDVVEISFGMGKSVQRYRFLRFIYARSLYDIICHYLQQRQFVFPIETIASRVWRRGYVNKGMIGRMVVHRRQGISTPHY